MLKNTLGYTLLELLTVLCLIGIAASIAVPGWISWSETTEAVIQVNQLVNAINLARAAAVQRNSTASICQSKDGLTCSGSWSDGYIIFSNKNKASQIAAKNLLIRSYKNNLKYGRLIWNSKTLLNINPFGVFLIQNGVFAYCPTSNEINFARKITISVTGRVRVERLLASECH